MYKNKCKNHLVELSDSELECVSGGLILGAIAGGTISAVVMSELLKRSGKNLNFILKSIIVVLFTQVGNVIENGLLDFIGEIIANPEYMFMERMNFDDDDYDLSDYIELLRIALNA